MTIVMQLQSVSRIYKSGSKDLVVLNNADLSLNAGELVGMVGPSGSGKSTLLHLAGLLEPPDAGNVFLEGEDCHAISDDARTILRRRKLGFVSVSYTHLTLPTILLV